MTLIPGRLPAPLNPGDTVCVIAPSGAVRDRDAIARGIARWRERGFRMEFGAAWEATEGYLAGSDRQRRQDLGRAWHNPDCKAILCARGGYGCTRLLEDWRWEPAEPPKWLIGFSDVTALLWSLFAAGIASVHGPVLSTLADEPDWSRDRLFKVLAGQLPAPLDGIGWGGGRAEGILLPGNLVVASHLLRTPWEPSFAGAILAFEEVAEAPYRVDRLLTQWRASGVLESASGIALGRFSRCEASPDFPRWTVAEVLRDRLQDLGIPIVAELPFGHDGPNAALPVGRPVMLDGDRGSLSWSPPGCSDGDNPTQSTRKPYPR